MEWWLIAVCLAWACWGLYGLATNQVRGSVHWADWPELQPSADDGRLKAAAAKWEARERRPAGPGRPVNHHPGNPPEQARQAAMGQLAQARTCLLIAERLLEAAGPAVVPTELLPRVAAAREQTEQLRLCVSALDPGNKRG